MPSVAAYAEFSKAFSTDSHHRQLAKVRLQGVSGDIDYPRCKIFHYHKHFIKIGEALSALVKLLIANFPKFGKCCELCPQINIVDNFKRTARDQLIVPFTFMCSCIV
jgi:hypothetical protein